MLHCRRGKHDEKWFTIYICESDSAAKDFKVKLSNESLAAMWMPLKEVLFSHALHRLQLPVVLSLADGTAIGMSVATIEMLIELQTSSQDTLKRITEPWPSTSFAQDHVHHVSIHKHRLMHMQMVPRHM